MTDQERSQIALLRKQGCGYGQIAAATGIKINTVKTYCRRLASETARPEEAVCKMCGSKFSKNSRHPTKVFCSDRCRWSWWNSHKDQVNKKAFYRFTCQHCGVRFERYGVASRKFCSYHCFNQHRRKEEP